MFINYFKDLLSESAITWSEPVLVFSDNKFCGNKEISCLNWHPMIYGKVQCFSVTELLLSANLKNEFSNAN